MTVNEMALRAREASRKLAVLPGATKDAALRAMADALRSNRAKILEANAADVSRAEADQLEAPKVRRLKLSKAKIESMAQALEELARMPDPVGGIEDTVRRPNGLLVGRMRVPLGVVAMIYESRPDATSDAISLCLKSGNAALLRGGKEALQSNLAIESALREAADAAHVPEESFQVIPRADRADVDTLLGLGELIDLMVPRGGESLIHFVSEHATMPVLKHAKGVCHVYVDRQADIDVAARIVHNGKTNNVAVCNATEAVLVHREVAESFWKKCAPLLAADGVEVRGDAETAKLVAGSKAATEDDWGREYLDKILAARVVRSFEDALTHLARYSSNHTEAIVTRDLETALRFQQEVDASAVLVNASTRMNDGGVLGLGAELGISTSKLHAYGPMGLEELTTRKFVVTGHGHLRD